MKKIKVFKIQPLQEMVPFEDEVQSEVVKDERMAELEKTREELLELNERKTAQMAAVIRHMRQLTNDISTDMIY